MLEGLLEIDRQVLLFFNGSDSILLDGIITTWTSGFTWIPLYIALFYLVVRNNETMEQIGIIILCCALCLLLSGGFIEIGVKPFISRLRPINDVSFKEQLDMVQGVYENSYSFFSSHAANTFSIAILFSFIVKNKTFTMFMVTWSIINCYTRLYLGLHYPSDIIVGLVYGSFIGYVCYFIYCKLYKKTLIHKQDKNANLILPKYEIKDIQIVLFVFSLLFFYILIKGLLFAI